GITDKSEVLLVGDLMHAKQEGGLIASGGNGSQKRNVSGEGGYGWPGERCWSGGQLQIPGHAGGFQAPTAGVQIQTVHGQGRRPRCPAGDDTSISTHGQRGEG